MKHKPQSKVISWSNFEDCLTNLLNQMEESGVFDEGSTPINKILYVARGGMVPATMLAHSLGIRDVQQIDFDRIHWELFHPDTLIIDDILDTGETLTKLFMNALDRYDRWDREMGNWNLRPYFHLIQARFAFPYIRSNNSAVEQDNEKWQDVVSSVKEFVGDMCFYGAEEPSSDWLVFPWENWDAGSDHFLSTLQDTSIVI